ncbi:MAG: DUF2252 family protein [Bacteroidota bacterium]
MVRLVTSIFIAFDSLKIENEKSDRMAALFLKSYASTLAGGKPNYIEPKTASGIVKELLSDASKQTIRSILLKRTFKKQNSLKITLKHPKHLKLEKTLKKHVCSHMDHWLQNDGNSPYNYKILDASFRIAGTGSLGLKRYLFLLKSLNKAGEPYILLDMKQTEVSSLSPFLSIKQREWSSNAIRIQEIQRRMQNRPPALLSTTNFKDESYIVQEMQPEKDSINFNSLKDRYKDMCGVIADMGMLPASSQLRSAGRQGSANADELIAFGQEVSWIDILLQYAKRYAAIVKKDYGYFLNKYIN